MIIERASKKNKWLVLKKPQLSSNSEDGGAGLRAGNEAPGRGRGMRQEVSILATGLKQGSCGSNECMARQGPGTTHLMVWRLPTDLALGAGCTLVPMGPEARLTLQQPCCPCSSSTHFHSPQK